MSAEETTTPAAEASFKSGLGKASQRFLAGLIEAALEIGQRTPADFLRCFPPEEIMSGLAGKPDLRATILEATVGVRRKVGIKKSPASSAEDLRIAIDERETDAAQVVALFAPDDRVRYLDNGRLWAFLTEGEPWTTKVKHEAAYGRATAFVRELLDRALEEKLLSPTDLVDGVGVDCLAKHLPRPEFARVLEAVLAKGRDNGRFLDRDLLRVVPPRILVECLPLPALWDGVVVPSVAAAHGLGAPPPEVTDRRAEDAIPDPVESSASFPLDLEADIEQELRAALPDAEPETIAQGAPKKRRKPSAEPTEQPLS